MRLPSAMFLWAVAGCSSGASSAPPLRFQTAHFRYHAFAARPICDGLGDWLERQFSAVTGFLGVQPPPDARVDVYVYDDPADVTRLCGARNGSDPIGCADGADGDRVITLRTYHPHEYVHAYSRFLGDPPLLFQEGLADVLGCGLLPIADDIPRSPALRSLVENTTLLALPGADQARARIAAAGFTRFLLDRHGRASYLRFYAGLPPTASVAQVDAAFAAAFGETLDQALAAWVAGPPQTRSGVCLSLVECSTEPIGADSWDTAALACGPAEDDITETRPLAVIRRVSLTEPAGVELRLFGAGDLQVELRSCSGDAATAQGPFLIDAATQAEIWTDLAAGDYWLIATMPAVASAAEPMGQVAVKTGAPVFSDLCAATAPRPIPAATRHVVLRGSLASAGDDDPVDGVPDVALTFALDAPAVVGLTTFSVDFVPYDGDTAILCREGCPATNPVTCSTGSLDHGSGPPFVGTTLAARVPYTLILEGNASRRGVQVGLDLASP
jgi:hypothetical protein